MKLLTCILPLLFAVLKTQAQNHVPNPSFEQYSACPSDFSQFTNYCANWNGYTASTPDYFNSCNANTVNVPQNFIGHQVAAHGNAYAGVFSFIDTALGGTPWKEYIQVDITPLEEGQSYDVSMSVSLADSVAYASDDLGVFFYHNAAPFSGTTGVLAVSPQISYSSYGPVTDKSNWVRLTASFVADSAYSHIIIGGFKNASTVNYVLSPPTGIPGFALSSYYYIDLIEIVKSRPTINFTDTSLCGGDTITVPYNVAMPSKFLPNNVFTLQLSNAAGGFANPTSLATVNGTMSGMMQAVIPKTIPSGSGYRLRLIASAPADTSLDNGLNIRITQMTAPIATINTPVCQGDTLHFAGTAPSGSSYTWLGPQYSAAGDSAIAASSSNAGDYFVTAALYACMQIDTIAVFVKPVPTAFISSNAPVCNGGLLELFASSSLPFSAYNWSGPGFSSSAQNPRITNAQKANEGTYSVIAIKDGCESLPTQLTIEVFDEVPPPEAIDTSICRHTPSIVLTLPAADSIRWYEATGATAGSFMQPLINSADTGTIVMEISRILNGCESERTRATVRIQDRPYLELGEDTVICAEKPFRVDIGYAQPGISYHWNNGSRACCINVRAPGTYVQTVANSCGSATDSIKISAVKCDFNTCIVFPTVFTPNGDGLNDLFGCIALCPVLKYELRIYNRWGQQVFYTTDVNGKWDGTCNGIPQDQNTFYYFIRYILDVEGQSTLASTLKGDVILLR